jgi:predicted enzyme related to lactoylglutathione lyase
MSASQGKFVWYDLMTTDTKAAEAFYCGVLGWAAKDSGMPGMSYTILSVGETMIGGLMPLPPEAAAAGARPMWTGYIGVDDVDAMAARVKQAGGSVHKGPEDIPGVGRFAYVADPQGAGFILFKGASDAQPVEPAMGTPGFPGWRELHAGNWESAFAFYSGLFGWTKAEAVDMGPMGTYQLFATGGDPVGGMMTKMENMPAPFWLYYFCVENVDAAAKRVTGGGGQVLNGPHEVPGGAWIVQCLDPQGGAFALVGPKL